MKCEHKKYIANWENIFGVQKSIHEEPEMNRKNLDEMCALYIKNIKIFFSDCSSSADMMFLSSVETSVIRPHDGLAFRESVLSMYNTCKNFTWESHAPLKKCLLNYTGLAPIEKAVPKFPENLSLEDE